MQKIDRDRIFSTFKDYCFNLESTLKKTCEKNFDDALSVFINHKLYDSTFETQFCTSDVDGEKPQEFWARLFEVYLGAYLINSGYQVTSNDEGPDFRIEYNRQVIWVEAVSCSPCDEIKKHNKSKGGWCPSEKILLRWTNAIKTKRGKFVGDYDSKGIWRDGYLQKGIIEKKDIVVIAVSSFQLGMIGGLGSGPYPACVECVYPYGSTLANFLHNEYVGESIEYRPTIHKKNKNPVSTATFLDPSYEQISALLSATCTPHGLEYIKTVHNYMAINNLPLSYFKNSDSYYVEESNGNKEMVFKKY